MKRRLLPLIVLCFLFRGFVSAQLPDGSIAPDWTLNDIFGNTHHLYDLIDNGKMVVIEFSATWCGPCWNYMQSGALETFWNQYGPNGTNQAQVFYIESDQSTGIEDLYGNTSASQGNWVANIDFPIIDLQNGENTDNDYGITYYPTLYAVCSDHTLWEVGQAPASTWEAFITSCTLGASVNDVEPAVCYGDGEISLDVAGGNDPIHYTWSNGSHAPTLQNVGAGTYSVTVTESYNKFVVLEDIEITGQDAPISLSSSVTEPALCNGSSTGSVEVELQEGTPPFSYSWSNGSNAMNLYNVPAGNYHFVATDVNGCTLQHDFTVTQPTALSATGTLTPDYCEQSVGTISLAINGGVGNYDVSASSGDVNGYVISQLPGGDVDVEIEDGNGCVLASSYEIEAEPAQSVYFTPNPEISCAIPTVNVTGFVQNGSGDFSYAWTTTDGIIIGPANQATMIAAQAGEYTLTVDDVFTGCQVVESVTVTSTGDFPQASAGEDAPITCEIQQLTLNGTGDASYQISWSTPDGHIVSGENTYNPVVDAPGTYTMTVVNPSNSCSSSDEAVVPNQQDPAVSMFAFQTSSLTFLGNNQSSGSNVGNFMWTFGDGNSSTEASVVHTYATGGTYEVCLSVENGCGTSQSCQMVEVTFTGSVISVQPTIQNILCHADSTGRIDLVVNGGSGVYTFAWTGPGGEIYTTDSLVNVPAGTYQLVITDDVGNVSITEYVITEPEALALTNSSVVDVACHGVATGSIMVDISGGVPPYIYSFDGGVAYQASNVATNLSAGAYDVWVRDGNSCAYYAGNFAPGQPDELNASVTEVTDANNVEQNNGTITLQVTGGVEPYSIMWSNGASGAQITGLVPGEYFYSIIDANGCLLNTNTPVVVPGTVSTVRPELARYFAIKPNPSRGNVVVSWSEINASSGKMRLMNSHGEKLSEKEILSSKGSWDLSNFQLPAGVYVILAEFDRQIVPLKLVIIE